MNPVEITLKQVQQKATDFLDTYHGKYTLPIPIEEIAEAKLNIFIQVIPGIKNILGIDAFINYNFTQITIDEYSYSKYAKRTRFSIAHEIGHLVLHKEWYMRHGPKNMEEFLTFQEKLDEKTYSYMERQADTFAGLVLVPTKQLIEEVRRVVGRKQTSGSFFPPIYALEEVFDVSDAVLMKRMQKEKILDKIDF